jgi:2-oxoglutarate ferredoxin oxidoreductase subunit beta
VIRVPKVFTPQTPIWCPGCGDFGVLASLKKSLSDLKIPPHETILVGGIGCSGHIHNDLLVYGYHSLHGRLLPTAIGIKLANPKLTVIAAGGDGDGYAIGGNHFLHALRRNPSIVYLVMNNGTYGLTKGQPSPTAQVGFEGTKEIPFEPILMALSIRSTTFVARGFSGNQSQLQFLMKEAIQHANSGKGFAFLDVLSPCVTYNDTYAEWRRTTVDLNADKSYDPTNRSLAFERVLRTLQEGKIPTGLLYRGESPSLEQMALSDPNAPMVTQNLDPTARIEEYRKLVARYR